MNKIAFEKLKQEFIYQQEKVEQIKEEQDLVIRTIKALKNDLEEKINNVKAEYKSKTFISSVNYKTIKLEADSIKSEIDYNNAYLEELNNKLYNERLELFELYKNLRKEKSNLLTTIAEEKINALFNDKAKELEEIYTLLFNGLELEFLDRDLAGNYHDTKEVAILNYIKERLFKNLNKNKILNDDYAFDYKDKDFVPKRPTQIHKEKFEQNKIGFEKLINDLTEGL